MTVDIRIPFGNETFPLTLPQATILGVKDPERTVSEQSFTRDLETFIEKNPLDLQNPVLVVADKTRLCGYPQYLPILVQCLQKAGMRREDLSIIIAYGTHPPQSEEECLKSFGDIYHQVRFVHHSCSEDIFVECGTTTRGIPVRVRKDILDASAVITMGAVCHHYFAGYGGGRKLIFPGCGEKEAIYANHSLFLNQEKGQLSAQCQPGVMSDNPLAEDLFEVETHSPADLAIHGILDSSGSLAQLLVGKDRDHFLHATQIHGENCEQAIGKFDTIIASCGGFPKDINFIQSHKAIHNASMFVKDGGTLVLYCECRDDIGSKTFLPWYEMGDFPSAFSSLSKDYQGNGGTALAMLTKTSRINIALVTNLSQETCKTIHVSKWSHADVEGFMDNYDQSKSLAYIANASLLVLRQE